MQTMRINHITVPARGIGDHRQLVFRVEAAPTLTKWTDSRDGMEKDTTLMRITDAHTGELYDLILPVVMASAMRRVQGDPVGRWFEAQITPASQSPHGYTLVDLYEIENPAHVATPPSA